MPVRTGKHLETVGLREVFYRAHQIDDLALPLAPATAGSLRVLVAILARLTGLDDPGPSTQEWTERRTALLKTRAGLDQDAVDAYFDRYIWDAFDPERPWLQDASLARQCAAPSGINTLIMGRPSGDNLCWFEPDTDTDPAPAPTDQALWHLLINHYYGNPGRLTPRTTSEGTSGQGTSGPIRGTLSFHPLGRTLLETLLLGLPPLTGDENTVADTCPWEEPDSPDPHAPLTPVTWPGRLLTGRSRHAVLLVPSPDGTTVTDAYLTWATQQPRLETTDPYLIYRTDPKAPVEVRRTPRLARTGRAVWRDLDSLLLAGDDTTASPRPTALTALNDLPGDVRDALRVRVIGFDQDTGLVKNRLWYTALTPPIWIWAQEHDPATARRIHDCCTTAERLGHLLGTVAARAWKEITSPPGAGTRRPKQPGKREPSWSARARAAYWPPAEQTFWRLINDTPNAPVHPAFAADAVRALHTVTTASLSQHARAAEVLAAAVATLLRDPDTPRPPRRQRKAEALP